jgi:hypothetical protein
VVEGAGYYTEEENNEEENKNDESIMGSMMTMSGPANQGSDLRGGEKADFVKDTFAKFGLSMNLYTNQQANEAQPASEVTKGSKRLRALLDGLPDYEFLISSKLVLPQAFFSE